MIRTLPDALIEQARARAGAVALRYKRRGVWRAVSWREVDASVRLLAAALARRGFVRSDALVVLCRRPSPEALLLILAAQWLGGVVVTADDAVDGAELETVVRELTPRFAFVEDAAGVRKLQEAMAARGGLLAALVYADGRGLIHDAHSLLVSFDALASADVLDEEAGAPAAVAEAAAVVCSHRSGNESRLETRSHAELTDVGRRVLRAFDIDDRHDALVPRSLALAAQDLLAPWLLAGFRLGFPETEATRDQDRRELAPTLLVDTAETYGGLAARVAENLPDRHSRSRRLVEWALYHARGGVAQALAHWLVRRPLRQVVGLSRVTAALVAGEPLQEAAAALFAGLGIAPRAYERAGGTVSDDPSARSVDDAAVPRRGGADAVAPSRAVG